MTDDPTTEDGGGRLGRWIALIALLLITAAVGRQIAIGSADRQFEARLAELDDNRD